MAALAIVGAGCAELPGARTSLSPTGLTPGERAVTIATTGCGVAPGGDGSGVLVEDGRVLTAAHVVVRSDGIELTWSDGTSSPGAVVALDSGRDVAIVRPDTAPFADVDPVRRHDAAPGEELEMVGGAASGSVALTVERAVRLDVEAVGVADERADRRGYELAGATAGGDSGAGIYDRDGRLSGVVFASSTDDDRITWATAASEVDAVLTTLDADVSPEVHRCDPQRSRLAVP